MSVDPVKDRVAPVATSGYVSQFDMARGGTLPQDKTKVVVSFNPSDFDRESAPLEETKVGVSGEFTNTTFNEETGEVSGTFTPDAGTNMRLIDSYLDAEKRGFPRTESMRLWRAECYIATRKNQREFEAELRRDTRNFWTAVIIGAMVGALAGTIITWGA